MAYIDNAEILAAKVFRFAVRLPKRYTFMLSSPLFEHAESVIYHCRAANLVFVKDRESYMKRRGHLIDAESHLLHVETLLGIIHETTSHGSQKGECRPPNENVYRDFAESILRERKLLSGVKSRDTSVSRSKGIIEEKHEATDPAD